MKNNFALPPIFMGLENFWHHVIVCRGETNNSLPMSTKNLTRAQPRSQLRKNVADAPKPTRLDVFKVIGTLITLMGIGAWIAGESYYLGFWSAGKGIGPVTQPTLQQTAFAGFTGPIWNWIGAAGITTAIGILSGLASIRSRTALKPPKFLVAIASFFKARFTLDSTAADLSQILTPLGIFFVYFMILPMIAWIYFASLEGQKVFNRYVCEARASRSLPTTVKLGDGTKLFGRVIDQSEKSYILLDKDSIYLLSLGDKSQILSTTSTADISCPASKS